MLLDREDARKLADVIGKKMAQEPGKWRAIAREVGPKSGCSSLFGPGDNLPAPGEAAHALNFMHHAVRGVRPYPENGGGGSSQEADDGGKSKDPCSYTCPVPSPDPTFTCSSKVPEEFTCPYSHYECCNFACKPVELGTFACMTEFECGGFWCSYQQFHNQHQCGLFTCDYHVTYHDDLKK